MTLLTDCKERLKIAFDSIRAVNNALTLILVVDQYGLKVISSTIKMMELITYGITMVERLQLKRKRYDKSQVVYLIDPSSYQKINEDFQKQQTIQYKIVHILSLSKIPQTAMNAWGQNNILSKRIKTMKQINFSFTLHNANQVKLNSQDPQSFHHSLNYTSQFLQKTIEQLSNIVACLSTFYIIQIYYQKAQVNNFTEKIATGLKQKLQTLFRQLQKNSVQNYHNAAPLTSFIILDRSYDPVSPLVRDFHYLPMLYELKNVMNHKIINKQDENKNMSLNQNDQIMQKYKDAHIATAIKGISSDFQQFSQNHSNAKFQKNQNGQDVDLNKLSEVIKKMPKYVHSQDRYNLHLQILQQIMNDLNKHGLKQQGAVEQSTISLYNQDGKKIKQKQALSNLIQKIQKAKLDSEKAKLVLIGLLTLQLKPKEQQSLASLLSKTQYKGIQKIINKISSGLTRLNSKKQSKGNQILDKHVSKIQQIVRQVTNQGHGDLKLIRVGAGGQKKSSKPQQQSIGLKKLKMQTQKKQLPRLIVYMNSAIGYNQMRMLRQFQNSYQMIYVSQNFVTHTQYLNLLSHSLNQQVEL